MGKRKHRLNSAWLRRNEVCDYYVDRFKQVFPNGAPISVRGYLIADSHGLPVNQLLWKLSDELYLKYQQELPGLWRGNDLNKEVMQIRLKYLRIWLKPRSKRK